MTPLLPALPHDLLEVSDAMGKPFLLMPAQSVFAHSLPHKRVRVVVRDKQKRVCIVLRTDAQQWNLPGDCVYANESAEDAAQRILHTHLGLDTLPSLTLRESPESTTAPPAQTTLFVTAPCVHTLQPNTRHIAESRFVDRDAILDMQQRLSDILDQELVYMLDKGLLFS